MTSSQTPRNKFLVDLLSLQQDGREAISAPTNWTCSRPLLEVETDLDRDSAELSETCLMGAGNKVARWHFFIGSPGNGKSAAVGRLVRTLLDIKGCTIIDEHGTDIRQLGTATVPYSLDVYEQGRKFVSVRIIQDASVVRNPYATDVDPSRDLLETLRDAWDAGISLVVCTNRGVLEKAYRDTYLDPAFKSVTWHRAILKKLVERDAESADATPTPLAFATRRPVFDAVLAKSTFLDKRSLILRQQTILDRLIQRAVEPDKWSDCVGCDLSAVCPFRANRDWLADGAARKGLINTLRRVEVLSSQVIVFREALALISFLLAGCARDYKDTDPCNWVRNLSARGDVFGLGARRVHMCLYATTSPRGLDSSDVICAKQLEAIQLLRDRMLTGAGSEASAHLTSLLSDPAPSADVGVTRLLGHCGVFSRLDAVNGPLPSRFSDDWDGNYERMLVLAAPLVSGIDRACFAAWKAYEEFAENLPTYEAETIHWAVRRWSSNYSLHMGALIEELVLDGREIDEYTELLELLWKDKASRTIDEKRRQSDLEKQIAMLLNRGGIDGDHSGQAATTVSENVAVHGNWVDEKMKPAIHASGASGSLTIGVSFGLSARPDQATGQTSLAAPMYLWLRQRAKGTMDPRCIPPDLLSDAVDAKSRAVGKSGYAFEPNHVALRIVGNGTVFKVERYDGETNVDVESQH